MRVKRSLHEADGSVMMMESVARDVNEHTG